MNNIISAYQSDDDDDDETNLLSIASSTPALTQSCTGVNSTVSTSNDTSTGSTSNNASTGPTSNNATRGYVAKRKRKHVITDLQCVESKTSKNDEILHMLSFYDGKSKIKVCSDAYLVPRKKLINFKEHTAPVTSLDWHIHDHRLLLSSSMDHSVRVWDPFMQECCVANYKPLNAAVQVSKWVNSHTAVCGGYSNEAVHVDLNTLQNILTMKQDSFVTAIKVHPTNRNDVIIGTYKSHVQSWDIRSGKAVNTYKGTDGQILDLEFLAGNVEMVASADVVKKNSSSETVVVWDYRSAVVRSNQIYQEPYTCPSLCAHPYEHSFVAQSNANYAVIFSARRPYKLNKYKRFEGHKVMGYRIAVDISPCGSLLCSGDANGQVYFYNYKTSKVLSAFTAYNRSACVACKFNPGLSSCIATCSWDGQVTVW